MPNTSQDKDPKWLSQQIIDLIRNSVLKESEECKKQNYDFDSWDEKQEGCNWVDNELYLFLDLYRKITQDNDFNVSVESCTTIKEVQEHLENQDISFLIYFHAFCKLGGTNNRVFFNLRDAKNTSEIEKYFDDYMDSK